MPGENTLTATPQAGAPAAAAETDVAKLTADNAMLKSQVEAAEAYAQKLEQRLKAVSQADFAKQLFLQNLDQVNAPNVAKAWEWTEEQLKFLQSKEVI